jgi:dolichol-phosphate mannosyltransferase
MHVSANTESASNPAAPGRLNCLELSVIVPTYNERENVRPLFAALAAALGPIQYEIIFVDDDSPDGTAAEVRSLASSDRRVRVIQRVGRRGLASACIEGMLASSAPYLAVIDGDLQHDESILPKMLRTIRAGNLDLVIASRNVEGGGMGEFARWRVALSNLGLKLSRLIARCEVTDPMSGFFVVSRPYFDEVVHQTSGIGFKILLDLIASSRRPVRFAEEPYTFRNRQHGESKLDINVGLEYLSLLADKLLGEIVPVRFLLFGMVGTIGLCVHLGLLAVLRSVWNIQFGVAQSVSTAVAIALNYALNNLFTYRDMRRRGWGFLGGLVLFYAACGFGALANVATAEFLFHRGVPWFGAGALGLLISAVWNFGATSVFIWRIERRQLRLRQEQLALYNAPAGLAVARSASNAG